MPPDSDLEAETGAGRPTITWLERRRVEHALLSYSSTFTDPEAGKGYTLVPINRMSDITCVMGDSDPNALAPGFVATPVGERIDTRSYDTIEVGCPGLDRRRQVMSGRRQAA